MTRSSLLLLLLCIFEAAATFRCGVGLQRPPTGAVSRSSGVRALEADASPAVVSVSDRSVECELCVPMVKTGGAFLAAKNSAASAREELAAAAAAVAVLGGAPFRTEEVRSVGPDGRLRTAVVSRETTPTPAKYPRRAGMPNKRPL